MSPSVVKKTAGPREPPTAAAQVSRPPQGTENTAGGAAPPCLPPQGGLPGLLGLLATGVTHPWSSSDRSSLKT